MIILRGARLVVGFSSASVFGVMIWVEEVPDYSQARVLDPGIGIVRLP